MIEMTRKKGMNKPGFIGRTCPTNISRDRVKIALNHVEELNVLFLES